MNKKFVFISLEEFKKHFFKNDNQFNDNETTLVNGDINEKAHLFIYFKNLLRMHLLVFIPLYIYLLFNGLEGSNLEYITLFTCSAITVSFFNLLSDKKTETNQKNIFTLMIFGLISSSTVVVLSILLLNDYWEITIYLFLYPTLVVAVGANICYGFCKLTKFVFSYLVKSKEV